MNEKQQCRPPPAFARTSKSLGREWVPQCPSEKFRHLLQRLPLVELRAAVSGAGQLDEF
jgi:hypothetical protein